jgi:hypothetical protein
MIAVVRALEYVAASLKGTFLSQSGSTLMLFSDSELTLNRIFKSYSNAKLPSNVVKRLGTALATLKTAGIKVEPILLAGHPTKADLAQGFKTKKGKRYPVSLWNVRVDKACKEQAKLLGVAGGNGTSVKESSSTSSETELLTQLTQHVKELGKI